MLYLVESHPSMLRGNTIDSAEGPGPEFAKIFERFKPEASARQSEPATNLHGRESGDARADDRIDVRPHVVGWHGTDIHSRDEV